MRTLLFVALATMVIGCSAAPAATPIIVYVTPEPVPSATSAPASAAAPTDRPTPATAATVAPTPRPTAARATTRPQPTQPPREDIEIVELGFSTYKGQYDDGHSMSWAVIVRNPNSNAIARNVRLSVEFVDSSGSLVGTVNDSWPAILPGQTVALGDELSYFSNDDLESVTDMEAQILHSDDWEAFTGTAGTFEFESVRSRASSIGSLQTTARLSSTFVDDIDSPIVVAVYRRDGEIVGGAFTFADLVPSGGHVGVEIYGPSLRNVDDTEMFGHLSNISLFN